MFGLRPFQVVVIAFFGIAALVGLFVFATYNGGSKKEQVGAVVIWGTLPKDAVNAGISALSAAQDQYGKVTYVEQPEAGFDDTLANALASGTGPDLVIISQEQIEAEAPKLRLIPYSSLPKRSFLDAYLPEFELYLTDQGTYGIPLVLDPLMLYWNRSILSSAGVASAPSTWEAVAGLAPTITTRTDSGTITRSLVPLGEYGNVRNARAIVSLLLLQAGTPITAQDSAGLRSIMADDSATFGSTPAQSAVSFYAQFADPAKTLYSWNRALPESRQDFVAGDLALYPGFASERPYLSAANPNLDFDMAQMPVPGTLANRLTYGLAYALAIPKAAKNPAGAYLAAVALSGGDVAFANALSMAPARRADLAPAPDDKYESVFYPEALAAKGWLSPSPATTDGVFSGMMDDVITGRKSVEQAVATAAAAITAALQ